MKRILFLVVALAAFPGAAQACAGFSCEADDKNVTRFAVGGATPRSEPGLINFGAELELDGKKIEFKKSDVKSFYGAGGIIRVRFGARSGEQTYTINVNVKRNPQDEDDWPGTYEVTYGSSNKKDKTKPVTIRGKVKCFVE